MFITENWQSVVPCKKFGCYSTAILFSCVTKFITGGQYFFTIFIPTSL